MYMILAVSLVVFREAKINTLVELLYFNRYVDWGKIGLSLSNKMIFC